MAKPKAKKEDDILDAPVIGGDDIPEGVEMMDTTVDGQRLIPGAEIPAIKQIVEFVARNSQTKAEHKVLTDKLKGEKQEGLMLYDKYKEHFEEDEDGNMVYDHNGAYFVWSPGGDPSVKTKVKDEVAIEKALAKKK